MTRRSKGDGSISSYRLANGGIRWRCQWYEPKDPVNPHLGKRLVGKGGFASQAEARVALLKHLVLVSDGRTTTAQSRTTFDSYARRWLAGYHFPSPNTRVYVQRVINAVQPHIGNLQISQVLPSDLAACYRALENGTGRGAIAKSTGGKLAPSTVARYSGWLVTIFGAATDDGLITRNPASNRRSGRPRGPQARRVKPFAVWNADQMISFCDWAVRTDQPWARAWWILALTGLRSGELLGLEWQDVNLTTGSLMVKQALRYNESLPHGQRIEIGPTKHGRIRTVQLELTARKHFALLKQQRDTTSTLIGSGHHNLVFPPRNGRSPSQSALLSAFKRAQAGYRTAHPNIPLPNLTVHDLRHTHASLLLAAGVDIKVIQERLGHSSASTTLGTYAHLMPDAHQGAASRLQNLLAGGN
ncbi:site-specific integrase [Cellulosimicrobium sp. KWT-B]|uniref:tyrosine-type recombinase/integrase n=1 Tax=Cellulosimicrobium sp. KWT-B TaxID=1981152 RepID=UPI000A32488A|nr:site-specific integrase [Cellulosimicrobium sp. KWT-B]